MCAIGSAVGAFCFVSSIIIAGREHAERLDSDCECVCAPVLDGFPVAAFGALPHTSARSGRYPYDPREGDGGTQRHTFMLLPELMIRAWSAVHWPPNKVEASPMRAHMTYYNLVQNIYLQY